MYPARQIFSFRFVKWAILDDCELRWLLGLQAAAAAAEYNKQT